MDQERDKVTAAQALSDVPDPSAETEQIRSQIEQTRAGVSQTIDAIEARLNPSRVATEAAETVKAATIGRVKTLAQRINSAVSGATGVEPERALAAVARHPVPTVILGAAATAIVARTLNRSRTGSAEFRADRYRYRIGRQLLFGACAGVACWTMLKTRKKPEDI